MGKYNIIIFESSNLYYSGQQGESLKKQFILVILTFMLLFYKCAFAEEELLYSNFNSDPVQNGPAEDAQIILNGSDDSALITRVRTYHWNDGDGVQAGSICIQEDEQEYQCWHAVGRSENGKSNIYWEALVDMPFFYGHSYKISVSDNDSWSYNAESGNTGFYELYGTRPIPEGYTEPLIESDGETSAVLDDFETVFFGHFEQNNDSTDGDEEIEWLVLQTNDDVQLLISKYGLDATPYFSSLKDIHWESSSVRDWLNDEFYNKAFDDTERKRIRLANVENPGNPEYRISGGNTTTDHLFLFSAEEAEYYFHSDDDRVCEASADIKSKVSDFRKEASVRWLLRSPGSDLSMRSFVDRDGSINKDGENCGQNCDQTWFAVRPAFWMSLVDPDSEAEADAEPIDVSITSLMPADPAADIPSPDDTAPVTELSAISNSEPQIPQNFDSGTIAQPVTGVSGQIDPSSIPEGGFSVHYIGNDCLLQVPEDLQTYLPGSTVTVLFEPVEYKDGLIFYGWDGNGDGAADFGYNYNTFMMPNENVELKAICIAPYYPSFDISAITSYISSLGYGSLEDLYSQYYSFDLY